MQQIALTQETFKIPPMVHMVQNDTGRTLRMNIKDATLGENDTAEVAINRSDGSYYTISATRVSGENAFTADMTQALTQPGLTKCQLKVTASTLVVSTYTFTIHVEESTDGVSEEQLGYSVQDIVQAAQDIMTGGMPLNLRLALLQLAQKVAYIDENGQQYYQDLYDALMPSVELVSISAVYTQSGTVYDTDTLASLKADLVVTATYSDSSTETLSASAYTLSGTLTEGTSTITVSYDGKTDTFTVTVDAGVPSGYTRYDYLVKEATKQDMVNTGLYNSPSFATLDCDFEFSTTNTTSTREQAFGARIDTGSSTSSYCFFFGTSQDNIGFRSTIFGSSSLVDVGTFSSGTVRHCSYKYNSGTPYLTIDGGSPVYIPNVPSTIATNSTRPLYLCGMNNNDGGTGSMTGASTGTSKWGRVTFSSNGTKVYDFIPAYNGTKYGYYEKVNGVFYPSYNTYISGGNYS